MSGQASHGVDLCAVISSVEQPRDNAGGDDNVALLGAAGSHRGARDDQAPADRRDSRATRTQLGLADSGNRSRRRIILLHKVTLAGSSDMTSNVADRIRAALRTRPMNRRQLEKAVGAPPLERQGELRRLMSLGRIRNIGTPSCPEWSWLLGNLATSAELRRALIWLLRRGAMTIHDLAYATGVQPARVVLEVQAIQRSCDRPRPRRTSGEAGWMASRPSIGCAG